MSNSKRMSENKQLSYNILKFTYVLLVVGGLVLVALKLTDVIILPWVFALMPLIVSNVALLPLLKSGKP